MNRAKIPPIINTRVNPTRDQRTLVHFKDQDITNPKWSCYDGLVTSIADFIKWQKKTNVLAIVLETLAEADLDLLEGLQAKPPQLFVTQAVASAFPQERWASLRLYVGITDKFHEQFPVVGFPCQPSIGDMMACASLIFHFRMLVTEAPISAERLAHLATLGVRTQPSLTPPSIWLLTQYFVHSVTKRAREIRQCLKNNLLCDSLDRVVLLNESNLSYEWSSMRNSEKVTQEVIGHRLTYADLLRYTLEKVPTNTIVIFANADIYCNATLRNLYSVSMKDKLFALLRWDEGEGGAEDLKLFGPRPDSQDAWIVDSGSVKARTWDLPSFEYKLGTAGCDNRMTADMFGMRFLVSNPCHTIQTVHIHRTEIRNYNKTDIVPAKLYLYVNPCPLLDIEPRFDTTKPSTVDPDRATVKVQCPSDKQAVTFCTMLARENRFKWSPTEPNPYTCSKPALQTWTNKFVMPCGFVYDYQQLYYGAQGSMDAFFPAVDIPLDVSFSKQAAVVESMAVVPVATKATMLHADLYCLHYLSHVIRLCDQLGEDKACPGVFVHANNVLTLQSFAVKTGLPSSITAKTGLPSSIPAISWSPTTSVYAKNLVGYYPAKTEVTTAQIGALRKAWTEWSDDRGPLCVVLIDELLIPDFVETAIRPLLPADWTVRCVPRSSTGVEAYRQLVGASLCILYNLPKQAEQWAKLWALPSRCRVLEFQNELKVEGGFQHFAAACDFDCWYLPLYKGSPVETRVQIGKALTAERLGL
jgi:hypothetical protein